MIPINNLVYNLISKIKRISPITFFSRVFGIIGILSAILSVFDVFKPISIPHGWESLLIFSSVAIILAFATILPQDVIEYYIDKTDVILALTIKDLFNLPGSIIIPINNQFLADPNRDGSVVKAKSVQGELVRRFYDDNLIELQQDINKALKNIPKLSNKPNTYKIGTVIKIKKNGRTFFLVASTSLSSDGVAQTNNQMLQETLYNLWANLSTLSKQELVIPLIGTGMGAVKMTMEEVVKEIILSFTASISENERNYCDKLTIVINPKNFARKNINLVELEDYMRLYCKFMNFDDNKNTKGPAIK